MLGRPLSGIGSVGERIFFGRRDGDSYKPKETALCETGYFFFENTGPSERSALILSGIGGLARWIRVRVFFVHDRPPFRVGAPFGCPGRRGTRGDELKPVGKAVRSFLFWGSSAGTYSRSEENVVGRIFIRRRRGLVFFVCAEPSFLLGKSGERGCVSCVSALRTAVRVTGLTGAIRYRPVGGGSAGWRLPLVYDLSHSLPEKRGKILVFCGPDGGGRIGRTAGSAMESKTVCDDMRSLFFGIVCRSGPERSRSAEKIIVRPLAGVVSFIVCDRTGAGIGRAADSRSLG